MGISCIKCPFDDKRDSLIIISYNNKKELKYNTLGMLEEEIKNEKSNNKNYNDLFCIENNKLDNQNINEDKNKYINKKSLSSNQSDFNDNYEIINSSTKSKNKDIEELNITFLLNGIKELYLSVNSSLTIKQVLEKLKDKYKFIHNYKEINFYFNEKIIEENVTIKELEIKDYDGKIKIQAL